MIEYRLIPILHLLLYRQSTAHSPLFRYEERKEGISWDVMCSAVSGHGRMSNESDPVNESQPGRATHPPSAKVAMGHDGAGGGLIA